MGKFAKVISAKNSAKVDSRKLFLAKKNMNSKFIFGLKLEGIIKGINIESVFLPYTLISILFNKKNIGKIELA